MTKLGSAASRSGRGRKLSRPFGPLRPRFCYPARSGSAPNRARLLSGVPVGLKRATCWKSARLVRNMTHPKLDLSGKTAVVIGGTSGIGLALNKGLALAGANVVPTGRRTELVRKAAEEVKALGRRSLARSCDVTNEASIEELLKAVLAEFESVEILVNCAGRTKRTPTLQVPEEE